MEAQQNLRCDMRNEIRVHQRKIMDDWEQRVEEYD